jgi:hypothetical protein
MFVLNSEVGVTHASCAKEGAVSQNVAKEGRLNNVFIEFARLDCVYEALFPS